MQIARIEARALEKLPRSRRILRPQPQLAEMKKRPVMFWRQPQPPGIVVDPQKEAQRLRENAALGQSQETGETPIVQPK